LQKPSQRKNQLKNQTEASGQNGKETARVVRSGGSVVIQGLSAQVGNKRRADLLSCHLLQ
jgi:hypothetical protein